MDEGTDGKLEKGRNEWETQIDGEKQCVQRPSNESASVI